MKIFIPVTVIKNTCERDWVTSKQYINIGQIIRIRSYETSYGRDNDCIGKRYTVIDMVDDSVDVMESVHGIIQMIEEDSSCSRWIGEEVEDVRDTNERQ